MIDDPIFEKYSRTTRNLKFKKVPKNTCKYDNSKIYQEQK